MFYPPGVKRALAGVGKVIGTSEQWIMYYVEVKLEESSRWWCPGKWMVTGCYRAQSSKGGGALRFGNDGLSKITSLQACQWCQTSVLAIVKKLIPSTTHPSLAILQKVPDTLGAALWRRRGSDEYLKGQRRSPLTSVTANDPREGWDGVNVSGPPPQSQKKKICHCVRGVKGRWWVGPELRGSGWWWVPDWGTSGDFWRGRAMHHVSCYQP